jgi:prophage antirepressor-like protein
MAAQLISVNFHDQSLVATVLKGQPYVALKPICENLGLTWHGQFERIKRHPVLNSTVRVIRTTAEDVKQREMVMLPLDYLNGWLFGIDVFRVKPEVKDRLIAYQKECFDVLAAHFWPQLSASKSRKPKALPNGLTLDQQDTLKALVKHRAQELPQEKQAGAIIKQWSALKTKFGCSYKNITPEQFVDAISLISRLPLEGDYLPHERCEAALNSVDLAFLHCTWEETQNLIKDIEPVMELFFLSTPMVNAHTHLKNMQTAVTHLRKRFQTVMESSARKHGLFDRQHYKPVHDAGMPEDNGQHSITLNLGKISKGETKRWLVTQARDEMVMLHSLANDVEVMTREQFIRDLNMEGFIVAKPDELMKHIAFKQN